MIARAGIKAITLWQKGYEDPPQNLFRAGLRDNAELSITEVNSLKTIRNVNLPVQKNFKISSKTYQATFANLKIFDTYVKDFGCEGRLIATPQTLVNNTGGIFYFADDNYLGVMFKFLLSNKERSLSFDLEMATDPYTAANIITSAGTLNSTDVTGVVHSSYYPANLYGLEYNSGVIFNKDEYLEWSFALETKETEKTIYNRSKVDYYKINLTAKGADATVSKLINLVNANNDGAVVLTSKYSASQLDTINILANVIAKREEVMISDNTRNVTVIWEAEIPVQSLLFSGDHTINITTE